MASSEVRDLTTLKRGWLAIQRPGNKIFKSYFALLRPQTLDCYSNASIAQRDSRRATLELQLRNCIVVQALNKEGVKNGFSMLMVTDGLYTITAVSETECTSWLNHIRDAIAQQVKQELRADESSRKRPSRKRQESMGTDSGKSGHRSRIHLSKQKYSEENILRNDMDGSGRTHHSSGRSSALAGKVTSSAVSLQDKRSKAFDRLSNSSRGNSRLSNIDTRSGDSMLIRSSNQIASTGLSKSSNIVQSQSSNRANGSVISIRDQSNNRNSNTGSTQSAQIQDSQRQRESTASNESKAQISLSTDSALNKIPSTRKQSAGSVTTQDAVEKPPEPTRPLVWSTGDRNYSLLQAGRKPHERWTPTNQMNGRLPSPIPKSLVQKDLSPSERTGHVTPQSVATTHASSLNSKRELPNLSGNSMESPSKITIFHAANKSSTPDRAPISRPVFESPKLTVERSFGSSNVNGPDVQLTNDTTPDKTIQWKSTGAAPSMHFLKSDSKRASFYTVKRYNSKTQDTIDRSIPIYQEYKKPVTRTTSQESLYIENQRLREQIRALTTTNYELEAKMNFHDPRALSKNIPTPVKPGIAANGGYRPHDTNAFNSNDQRTNSIPIIQNDVASVDTLTMRVDDRVQSWLMATPNIVDNKPFGEGVKKKDPRRNLEKVRRNTTGDIPTPEEIRALGLIAEEANGPTNVAPVTSSRAQLKPGNAYERLKYRGRSSSILDNNFDHTRLNQARSNHSPERPQSRLMTPSLPEPIDPRYASSMWCRLVDLWSNLLNEERGFWKNQLQQLFTDAVKRQFEQDPNDLIEVLDRVNRQHTEETVELWKHIYESWIPRDYLDYFTTETRKLLVCLHSVIDGLFSMVDEMRFGVSNHEIDQRLDQLKEKMIQARTTEGMGAENERPGYQSLNSKSYGIRRSSNSVSDPVTTVLNSQSSNDSWKQTKQLLKESHSELLEQVYNVAELVGAALDAEMEDNIRSAKARGENDIDPLSTLPPSGLQAAAKLQSIVLDLESRLEVAEGQDNSRDQTNSQPLLRAAPKNRLEPTVNAFSEQGHRTPQNVNIVVTRPIEEDDNEDDDEDTYTGLNSNLSTLSEARPAHDSLSPGRSEEKSTNGPVIWVFEVDRGTNRHKHRAESAEPRAVSSYAESEVISIDTTRNSYQPELYDWRIRKN